MRVAVLSDVHSNLHALEAVLSALEPYDAMWVLGDTVGYGPQPDEVVERLRGEHAVAILGNHDAAVIGRLDTDAFNDDARAAVLWTIDRLGHSAREWLDHLPELRTQDQFTLSHGSPREPLWEYLLTSSVARQNFAVFETSHCLVGHTHVPLAFLEEAGQVETLVPSDGERLSLDDRRTILNPGAVGQPRDGDPRACAMLLDTDTMVAEWLRVPYPIADVQARMREAGLPERLVRRLAIGL